MIEITEDGKVDIVNWEKHQSTDKMARIREQNRLRKRKYDLRENVRRLGFDPDSEAIPDDVNKLEKLVKEVEEYDNGNIKEDNVTVTLRNALEVRSKKKEVRSKKKERDSRKFTFDDTQYELASLLWEKVKANFPKTKKPNLESWANDIRLMMEQDGRSVNEIKAVIEWSQKHDFWYANIRSARKLRSQYENMFAQADREKRQKESSAVKPSGNNYINDWSEFEKMIEGD